VQRLAVTGEYWISLTALAWPGHTIGIAAATTRVATAIPSLHL
jgi:hypothetical protein